MKTDSDSKLPVLSARGIVKRFGSVNALRGVDLEVRAGEVHALVGDNGAGKSTLVKTLSGVFYPDSGVIEASGKKVMFHRPEDAREAGIETVYQDLALALDLSAAANLFLGREILRGGVLGWLNFLDEKRIREESLVQLSRLSAKVPNISAPVNNLSGGQRQAIAIARAVMWASRLVFMDEPTAALGVEQTRNVLDLIRAVRDEGTSVVLISHNMQDVLAVSDRITVLRLGRNIAQLETKMVDADEIIAHITGSAALRKAS